MLSIYKNIFYDRKNDEMHIWTDDGHQIVPFERYGYIKSAEPTELKSIFGDYVKKIPVSSLQSYKGEIFESDVKPETRVLIDNYYNRNEIPKTNKTMILDIETEIDRKTGFSKPPFCKNQITAITWKIKETGAKKTLLLDSKYKYKNKYNYDFVETFVTEIQLLKRFLVLLNKEQPSIITGWNSRYFDIPYIYFRLLNNVGQNLELNLSPIQNVYYNEKKERIHIAGISELDYMLLYKKFTAKQRSSYSLEAISQIELGRGKIKYEGNLQDLYENDIDEYVKYNIEDVDLIDDMDKKLKMLDKVISFSHMACVPYEDSLSSVAHTEGLFLTKTKQKNLVVPNKKEQFNMFQETDANGDISKDKIVGAYVKDSQKGRFLWNYDEDLTSLYPLTDVTLNISPETKFCKIRNYIKVWQEHDKTHFRINHEIFKPELLEPDYDRVINVHIDYFDNRPSQFISTVGDLYKFLKNYNLSISGNGVMYKKDKMGIIPEIILEVFEMRKHYKNLRDEALKAGDSVLESYYDILQWNYKIIINAIYGVMCNQYFRFYDQDNGQSITLTGRFTNMTGMNTVHRIHDNIFSKIQHPVDEFHTKLFKDPILTGDTDSIIMTAMPLLYYKYGENYLNVDFDELLKTTEQISINIAEKINKRMDIFASKWLNADKSYLWFKQEWVADVGFYTGVKKRYANRIQLKEGIRKTELDVKGLDIVRSSFPKDCQVFMKGLLNKVLDGDQKDVIDTYVVSFFDSLTNMNDENSKNELFQDKEFDIYSIAPISSVNKFNKYVDSSFNTKKGASPAIKGSNNFNRYLNIESIQSEYQKINEGDKVCWLYLHKNPYGFQTISLPLQTRVPESLKEFIYEYTNYSKCVSTLLQKKVETYYNAMDWEDAYSSINNINSIFE